ncbi:hypothetical protein L7F22_043769 [Adiantum nelumboides]|nr:hypothetical protein [Adiantum nelumboides]
MANAAGGALAGKVSKAGGLGFIGAGYYTAEKMRDELNKAMNILDVQNSSSRVHLGIGFLTWRLTVLNNGKKPSTKEDQDVDSPAIQLIDAALRINPIAIWLSFGDEEEMIGWSSVVRKRDAILNGDHGPKNQVKLFIGIGNETQAKSAVEDCGADVLIIQGNEAGGHGLGSSPPLSAIVPLLAKHLDAGTYKISNPTQHLPPLLGAGGIMTGANMAGVLAMGADGVVVGTRMLMTPEAAYSDAQKKMLIEAGPTSTLRTMAFDEARNTLGWPKGVDGRGIVNETVRDYMSNKGGDGDARRAVYKEAEKSGDTSRIVTWAGTGVGLVGEVKDAEEIVAEMTKDCQKSIAYLTEGLKQFQ